MPARPWGEAGCWPANVLEQASLSLSIELGSCHSCYSRYWCNNYCLGSWLFKGSLVKMLWFQCSSAWMFFFISWPSFGWQMGEVLRCIMLRIVYIWHVAPYWLSTCVVKSAMFSLAGKSSRYIVQVYTPMFICFRYQTCYRSVGHLFYFWLQSRWKDTFVGGRAVLVNAHLHGVTRNTETSAHCNALHYIQLSFNRCSFMKVIIADCWNCVREVLIQTWSFLTLWVGMYTEVQLQNIMGLSQGGDN